MAEDPNYKTNRDMQILGRLSDIHKEISGVHKEIGDVKTGLIKEIGSVRTDISVIKTDVATIKEDLREVKGKVQKHDDKLFMLPSFRGSGLAALLLLLALLGFTNLDTLQSIFRAASAETETAVPAETTIPAETAEAP